MSRKLVFCTTFICLLSIVLFSCGKNKKAFTDEEKKIVDSLYRIKMKDSKAKLDSVCDSVYNAEFPVMVDSIKKVRKKEILDLIE